MAKQLRCCLCGEIIDDPYGNNPEPVRDVNERCCNNCNATIIIPIRFSMAEMTEKEVKKRTDELKKMSYKEIRKEADKILDQFGIEL